MADIQPGESQLDDVGIRQGPTPVWCIVANIVFVRLHGDTHEPRSGTKHFSPGAKVYVTDHQPNGTGGMLTLGHHRKSHRWIEVHTNVRHLANWRVELVYAPKAIEKLTCNGCRRGFPLGSAEQRQAEEAFMARWVNKGAGTQPPAMRLPDRKPADPSTDTVHPT